MRQQWRPGGRRTPPPLQLLPHPSCPYVAARLSYFVTRSLPTLLPPSPRLNRPPKDAKRSLPDPRPAARHGEGERALGGIQDRTRLHDGARRAAAAPAPARATSGGSAASRQALGAAVCSPQGSPNAQLALQRKSKVCTSHSLTIPCS